VSRPAHLNPALILLVAAGGTAGTLARYALSTAIPIQGGWPVSTLVENLVGSFLLGLLLEALVRAGDETPRRRLVRLGAGTGVLGGFTTFSTFALEVEHLLAIGAPGTALGYFAASLIGGFLACLAGVTLAAGHHRRRTRPVPIDPNQDPASIRPRGGERS
jgi:fluoride exporter